MDIPPASLRSWSINKFKMPDEPTEEKSAQAVEVNDSRLYISNVSYHTTESDLSELVKSFKV